jgi:hypothetical protein
LQALVPPPPLNDRKKTATERPRPQINGLETVTDDVIEAAASILVIGN